MDGSDATRSAGGGRREGATATAAGGGGMAFSRDYSRASSSTTRRGLTPSLRRQRSGLRRNDARSKRHIGAGGKEVYMTSTHELYLKKLPSSVPPHVQRRYHYLAVGLAACEGFMAVACLIDASKCPVSGQQVHPHVLGLVVPCCVFYAVGTSVDKCLAAVRIRAKYRDEQEWACLLHQLFTFTLELVMLATSAFIIANASDALTLTSQFVAAQLIAQIDVMFAKVLQIRDPAPDFFQSRLSGVSRMVERAVFLLLIAVTIAFTYAIRRGHVACTAGGGGGEGLVMMRSCCYVGQCFVDKFDFRYAASSVVGGNCTSVLY